jgi:hypothetical protein
MSGPEIIECVWVCWLADSVLCDARGLHVKRGDNALLRPATARAKVDAGHCVMADGEPGEFPGLGGRVVCVVADLASSPDRHDAPAPTKPSKGKGKR